MPSSRRPSVDPVEAHALEAAATLQHIGAKLVCIDFDATFVTVHTGGQWTASAADLQLHVRRFFLLLVPLLCDAHVHVAIVTFSPQVALIQDVLRQSFPPSVAAQLIVRGDDRSWAVHARETTSFFPDGPLADGRPLDRAFKVPFIVSAALAVHERSGDAICNRDTVLVDDDVVNVRVATDCGVVGLLFDAALHDMEWFCKRMRRLLVPAAAPTLLATPQKEEKEEKKTRSTAAAMLVGQSERTFVRSSNARRRLAVASGSGKRPTALAFNLCTPSPVMRAKCSVDMGRPRSKRASRSLRSFSREADAALPVVDEGATFASKQAVPRTPVATVSALSVRETLAVEGLQTSPLVAYKV
ncbi:unnamed protein product [Hyaloperonospora brassicae]|uniref:FCP1 homology domain-containing protein n=1 Tax=Hyaloperonospora brassicae TaxID=162125 RepID=A0AAV0UYN9_HYABA|nr:unnamed protein product [Hyaloperonospora brassicae]